MELLEQSNETSFLEISPRQFSNQSKIDASACWSNWGGSIVHLDVLGRCSIFDLATKTWAQEDLLKEWESVAVAASPDCLRVVCFGSHREMPENERRAFLFDKDGRTGMLVLRMEAEALCLGPNSVFRFDLHGLEILDPTSLLAKSQHYLGNAVWPLPTFEADFCVEHSYNSEKSIVHSANGGSVPLQDLIDVEIGHVNWSEFRFNPHTQQGVLHVKKSEADRDGSNCSAIILNLLDPSELTLGFLTQWNIDATLFDLHFVPAVNLMLVAGAGTTEAPAGNSTFQIRRCNRFASIPTMVNQWIEISDAEIRHVFVNDSSTLTEASLVGLPCPAQDVSSFEVSPNGEYLLIASSEGYAWVYDLNVS